MKWSQNNPTKAGYYWLKQEKTNHGKPHIVKLMKWGQSIFVYEISDETSQTLSEVEGLWYGPIEPPKEENI